MEKSLLNRYILFLLFGFLLAIILNIIANFYISLEELRIKEIQTVVNLRMNDDGNEEFKSVLKFLEAVIKNTDSDN